jgi:hypothetical protein
MRYEDAKCGCCGEPMRDCLCDEMCEDAGPTMMCKCGGERFTSRGAEMFQCDDCKRIDHEGNLYQ